MNIVIRIKIYVGIFLIIVSTVGLFMELIGGVVWGGIVASVLTYFGNLAYKYRKQKK